MQRSPSLDSLAGELGEARSTIETLKKQRRICKWMSIVLWINLILGIIALIIIRMSYLLEWEIMTGNIILAEINVNRENITGFDLSVWGTVKEKRAEIEKNNIHFWKWLNNVSTDKTWYYMIRQPKVKLKSTVKMKQWYRSETEIFEENSFIEENEGNKTFKYFIGSTYRISLDEELGGCWIFRSRKNFNPWKIGQCKEQGIVRRVRRSIKSKNIIHAEKIRKNIEEWIKTNKMFNPNGEFVLLTTTRDRHVGSRKTGYAELENMYETKFNLELNQSVPWVWKKRIAMPRVKFNFKTRYWEIDNNKWETDVYVIKMELNKELKTENEIKNYYEDKVKQMDKCVRTEISKNSHGRNYIYTKKDYGDFSYANFCDKDKDKMDCSDFENGTDPFTGNQTEEVLSIRRRLYLKRVNLYRRRDAEGIYRSNLIFLKDAVYGITGRECGKILKICSEGHDALTINQMASVLCYWYNGIVPLPWTFKRDKIVNRYVMNYGAGGVVRVIDKGQKWKMFHGPARIAVNSMLRYRVPKGGKNVPLTNIDAIAIDDLSLTIERKGWKESWCKGTDMNYYLGLEWMRTGVCNTSVEIKGQPIKGGPRWFEAPGEFVKTGIQGVKQAANAVFKFVTQDMWTGLVNGLINAGWYALYGGLIILGIFFISVIIKCSCAAIGRKICTGQKAEANELDVLERLVNLHTKGQRYSKT